MAENKEYISQKYDNGAVHISEEVIASVAGMAALDVEGVCGLYANSGTSFSELIGKKNLGKGIQVTVDEKKNVSINCFIETAYGQKVLDVAKNVQDAIAAMVGSVTGLTVTTVNVTVSGVVLPKDGKK